MQQLCSSSLDLATKHFCTRALTFQAHAVGHSTNLVSSNGLSTLPNDLGEGLSRNKRIDQITVKTIGQFSELLQGDAILGLCLLGFVKCGGGDAQSLGLLTPRPAYGFADQLEPPLRGRWSLPQIREAGYRSLEMLEAKVIEFARHW